MSRIISNSFIQIIRLLTGISLSIYVHKQNSELKLFFSKHALKTEPPRLNGPIAHTCLLRARKGRPTMHFFAILVYDANIPLLLSCIGLLLVRHMSRIFTPE